MSVIRRGGGWQGALIPVPDAWGVSGSPLERQQPAVSQQEIKIMTSIIMNSVHNALRLAVLTIIIIAVIGGIQAWISPDEMTAWEGFKGVFEAYGERRNAAIRAMFE
jgi:hypothetical protein